jgi:hypothetical protein
MQLANAIASNPALRHLYGRFGWKSSSSLWLGGEFNLKECRILSINFIRKTWDLKSVMVGVLKLYWTLILALFPIVNKRV